MRKTSRVLTLLVVMAVLVIPGPSGRTDPPSLRLARVQVSTPDEAAFIASRFDEVHVYDPGYVQILLWPGDDYELRSLGFEFETLINDMVAHDRLAEEQADRSDVIAKLPGPDRNGYRSLTEYVDEMRDLSDENPSLVKLLTFPHLTHEGRTVYGLEIAEDVEAQDGRPVFYVDGVHHAREWPAGEYPMIFAHFLVEQRGKNDAVDRLLSKGRVIIVPVVNVDGFDYSRMSLFARNATLDSAHGEGCGAAHCEAYWRKNRRSTTGLTVPEVERNPDAYGVDPNRNYSYHWGGGGSSNSTLLVGDQTYRGPAPTSEPETSNVEELLLARGVTAIISNHTYSRLVLRAWGDTKEPSPDERYMKALGARMAKAMGGYKNIKGIELYVTTGTLSDWGYGTLGIPSYTFEHGVAFHPPYTGCQANCVEKEWPGVMKAFMLAGQAALDPTAHGVITDRLTDSSGSPIDAKLTLRRRVENPLAASNPTGDSEYRTRLDVSMRAHGSFEWHVAPSTPPYLFAQGKTSTYDLIIAPKEGDKVILTFSLRRGQVMNLDRIRL